MCCAAAPQVSCTECVHPPHTTPYTPHTLSHHHHDIFAVHSSFYGRWISRNFPGLLPTADASGKSVYDNTPEPPKTQSAAAGQGKKGGTQADVVPPPQAQPQYGGTAAQRQHYTGPYRDNGSQGVDAYAGAVPISKNVSGKNTGRTQLPSAANRQYADAAAHGAVPHAAGASQPKTSVHIAGGGAASTSPKTHVSIPAHLVPKSAGATAPQQAAPAAKSGGGGGWFAAATSKPAEGSTKKSGVW